MKSRSSRFAAFRKHIITAINYYKFHTGKSHSHLKRSYPVAWIIGVVIVAVHWDIICGYEIRIATVIVFILGGYMVEFCRRFHRGFVCYYVLIGVNAV